MTAQDLARLAIDRMCKDHAAASYLDERARKVHQIAIAAALSNIAAVVAPHDTAIAELFADAAVALGATRGLGGVR